MAVLEETSFTSYDEMTKLFSQLGIDLRTDDLPADALNFYVSYGTSEVLFYVSQAGTAEQLAAVPWIRKQATISACLELSGSAGEPENATLAKWWEKAEEKLGSIQNQTVPVPGLVLPTDNGGGPVVANIRVDMQRVPSIRRIGPSSNDTPEGYAPPIDRVTQNYRGWP